jgi:hypothetical protein
MVVESGRKPLLISQWENDISMDPNSAGTGRAVGPIAHRCGCQPVSSVQRRINIKWLSHHMLFNCHDSGMEKSSFRLVIR